HPRCFEESARTCKLSGRGRTRIASMTWQFRLSCSAPLGIAAVLACHDATGPGTESFVAVSAGIAHTCALTASGTAYCWGRNLYGALGDGTTQPADRPVRVGGAVRFTAIAAGWDHTCALDLRGRAY